MAEGKKSFILYTDIGHTVHKLPDEKAGQLFKLIIDYVNDKNPETDDIVLQIAFEPIKQQFKRDLLKWDEIREKRSIAGKASAEKRSNTTQHLSTHDEEKNNSKQKKFQQVSTSVNKTEQDSTNPTVSVNVNENVNVNVSSIEDKKKKGKKENEVLSVRLPFDEPEFEKAWEDWKKYKSVSHKFKYANPVTEGRQLKLLFEYSSGDLTKAIGIIDLAIARNWLGFVDPRNNNNNGNYGTRQQQPIPGAPKRSAADQLSDIKAKLSRDLSTEINGERQD